MTLFFIEEKLILIRVRWLSATLRDRVLRGYAAVAQPLGELDIAALPPALPPAVPQDPVLCAILLLTVTQSCHCVSVGVPLSARKTSGGDDGTTMGREKLSTIGVADLIRRML